MSGFISEQKLPLRALVIGAGLGAAVTAIIMCAVCAGITFSSAVPYRLLPYILLIADAAGAFTGAYCAAAINKSKGLIIGLVCGAILFVILLIFGLSTGETVSLLTLLRLIVLLLCGALGGIKGVNKKERLHIK